MCGIRIKIYVDLRKGLGRSCHGAMGSAVLKKFMVLGHRRMKTCADANSTF